MADDVREKYWPEATLPINVEEIVEFRLKLIIDPKHNLFSEIDMDAYLKRDLSGIVVDYDFYMNEKFFNRMRFSFAHELGHFFLHKYIFSLFDFESPAEWRNFILNVPDKEYSGFEWQANEFAGRLLVPFSKLKNEFDKALKIIEEYKHWPSQVCFYLVAYYLVTLSTMRFKASTGILLISRLSKFNGNQCRSHARPYFFLSFKGIDLAEATKFLALRKSSSDIRPK